MRGAFASLLGLLMLVVAHCSSHSNNWAVIVSTSRYWFNYRHIANALSLYQTVKSLGIPDSQIILMLPDDMACNPRNSYPGQIFNNRAHHINLYGEDVEVDYRGTDVSVENFLRLLTGRQESAVPRSKRLLSDEKSNILIYMSGHGGDEFLKFNDQEEISSWDFAHAIEQMHKQKRYNEILLMVDTCQAASLQTRLYSPNVIAIGSSKLGENSYSHHSDSDVGLSVIDRFTYYTLEFFQAHQRTMDRRPPSIQDLFSSYHPNMLMSHAQWRSDLFPRPLSKVPVTDFFAAVATVHSTSSSYLLPSNSSASAIAGAAAADSTVPADAAAVNTAAVSGKERGLEAASRLSSKLPVLSPSLAAAALLLLCVVLPVLDGVAGGKREKQPLKVD